MFSEVGPNFFVIGAARAGTTRLCELLQRHQDVAIPIKEPAFFHSVEVIRERAASYRQLFDRVAQVPLRGDGLTAYSACTLFPGTAERVHQFNPDARIIYMVRNPFDRIESAWRYALWNGEVNSFTGFERTLMSDARTMLDPTKYWMQLSEYRKYFPDNQIRIGYFEDVIEDEEREVSLCLAFLGANAGAHIATNDCCGLNASEGRKGRSPSIDAVRRFPGYRSIKRFIPQSLKTSATAYFSQPIDLKSVWSARTIDWVWERIGDDVQELLRHTDRPRDFWRMPPSLQTGCQSAR